MAEKDTFAWEGIDRFGRKRSGESAGGSSKLVRAQLRRQGIAARRVRRKRAAGKSSRYARRVGADDLALFSRQLATMIRAGVPLVHAFEVVANSTRSTKLAAAVQGIRQDVAAGASLKSALAKFPALFDELYLGLIDVGEQSGALETMLERIAVYQERANATRRKLAKAMTYPCVVVVSAVVVTALLLVYVVPQFESVFAGVGAELPAFTRFVIGISDALRSQWPVLLALVGAVWAGGALLNRRSKGFRNLLDRVLLKAPIAGDIVGKAAVARFARTLATSIAAGMPLVEALRTVAGATGNVVYAGAVASLRDETSAGQSLSLAMRDTRVFPDMIVMMVAIGEESGSLDDMLARSATHFETQLDTAVDSVTSLVEPLLMAILGVVVGGLVVAMYLPVFQLGSVFGG